MKALELRELTGERVRALVENGDPADYGRYLESIGVDDPAALFAGDPSGQFAAGIVAGRLLLELEEAADIEDAVVIVDPDTVGPASPGMPPPLAAEADES